ncbi:hypothetical protein F5050DRAFT_200257 [Lentinula boryana]|uniref:Uncharacterized protein n=1 Tax=Lentinula boryana TaxID=40481 RepID=A0ABQ8QRH1_9AGAR|nr:hypothetical protein F5050DRAFT_200257 [Lentinula boryana]
MNDWNSDESTFIESRSLQAAPAVKILPETPPSASFHFVRSPPRSPRTTNLLLALKGVIRDDEEEEFVDDLSFEAVDDEDDDSLRTTRQTLRQFDTNVIGPEFHDPVSTVDNESERSPPSPDHSGLLSPVEFSDLQLKHFSILHSNIHSRNPSLDPGFYDSVGTPNSQWVSPSPMALSPPRSPAMSSTFELLASPFGSPSSRLIANPGAGILSPRLGVFTPRVAIPPSPLASTLDVSEEDHQPVALDLDLDSPTEYYQKKKDAERSSQLAQSQEQETLVDEFDEEMDGDGEYTGALTARWDTDDQDTVRPFFLAPAPPPRSKFKPASLHVQTAEHSDHTFENENTQVQEEVEEALHRRSASPLDYFRTPETVRPAPEFSPEEVEADSTAHIPVTPSPLRLDDDDETAQLAYLAGSPQEHDDDEVHHSPEEDDTINSLYDVYSDIDSESERAEEEEDDDEAQLGDDEDVCVSRAFVSHTSPVSALSPPISAIQSPSTALPHDYQRVFTSPPKDSSSSSTPPPTARVFTPPVHAPHTPTASSPQPPTSVLTDNEEHDDQSMPLPGFTASGRRSVKLRPLRLVSSIPNVYVVNTESRVSRQLP